MEAFRIAVKLFVKADTFKESEFVPIFHRLIQTQGVEDHLLIDVADYAHVPQGPGTVLVSLEANFYLEHGNENRLGLMYSRKQATEGSFRDRLRAAIVQALKMAALLEKEETLAGRLAFATGEMVIRLNDRLLAPNNEKTLGEVKPEIAAVAREVYGEKANVTIEPMGLGGQSLFEVRVKSSESGPVTKLLDRLASPVPAR